MITSANNKIICEPYKGEKTIKSKERSGFSFVEQKTTLVGLKVLFDSNIFENGQLKCTLKKDDTIFLNEERLLTHPEYNKPFDCKELFGDKQFVYINYSDVIIVKQTDR